MTDSFELDGEENPFTEEIEKYDSVKVHHDGRVQAAPLPRGIDPQVFKESLVVVSTMYGRMGVFPTVREAHAYHRRIKNATWAKIYSMPEFKQALELRGISMDPLDGLSSQQMLAIEILANPVDRRNTETRMKSIGVSMSTYRAWMRNKLFSSLIAEKAEQNLGDSISVAMNRLVANAEAGDQRAIEKVLEISGRYNPAQIEQANAREVILAVVEIVLRHVTDGDVKKAIIEDLQHVVVLHEEPKSLT